MKQWIGRKLGQCGRSLTGWSLAIRGIKPEVPVCEPSPYRGVPAAIGDAVSEATRDWALMQLEAVHMSGVPGTAASMSVGYADAYTHFALRHPDAFDLRTAL